MHVDGIRVPAKGDSIPVVALKNEFDGGIETI
jgi:hypothetical protein